MSNGKIILKKAIEIVKSENNQIGIEHKDLPNEFYYLKISIHTTNVIEKNYICSHEPYSELDKWSENDLAKRIINIAKHGWTF